MSFTSMYHIEKMLKIGQPFTLTNEQYKALIGEDFPQRIKDSAVGRIAEEHGFKVTEVRILKFDKKAKGD